MSRRTIAALLLALISFLPRIGLGQLQLGQITFPEAKAQPLDNPTQLAVGLQSHAYLSSVGGVAFGAIATNRTGQQVASLNYDARKPDGQRLKVIIESAGGRRLGAMAPIHDWQLIPIARFAATDQDACFTMFGRLLDAAEQELRQSQGQHILGYHQAFQNSLLGLRLYQADILILRPDACDLPKDGGQYLLGAGEQPPNLQINQIAFRRLQEGMNLAEGAFQSYVICDHEQEVVFAVHRGTLSLTGYPYWYCWRSKINDRQSLQQLQETANARANEGMNREFQKDQATLSAADLNQKWTGAFQQQRHHDIFDEVISANIIQPMPKLSAFVSTQVPRLNGVNPAVYQSLVTTMRYAALFRHFKQRDAIAYGEFVNSLAEVVVEPPIETPAVMADGNSNVRILRPR